MTARAPVAVRVLATGAFAVVALAGCSGGSQAHVTQARPTTTSVDDAGLDAARTSFDDARAALLAATAQISTGAAALDAQDTRADKGSFDPARAAEPAAAKDAASAASAAGRLATLLAADRAASARLATIAPAGITTAQHAALAGLSSASMNEAAAVAPLAAGVWTGYRQLQAAQALWLTRAAAGYYPDTNGDSYDAARAGDAYTVLVNPFRSQLDSERTTLATATARLAQARAVTATALDTARTAFG